MEKHILLSVSPYVHKYYFNEQYSDLPKDIKEELRAALGVIAQKVGCIMTIGFKEDGNVFIEVRAEDTLIYDEIGAELEIKKFQNESSELLRALKMWYMLYQTPNGAVMREIMLLQSQGKNKEEIKQQIVKQYGQSYEHFAEVLLED